MNIFTDAYAGTAANTGSLSFLPMLLILIVFMYLAMVRPQAKRAKEHKNLLNSLKEGDEVVTVGGILGKITKIADDSILLAVSEGMTIKVQKHAISSCIPKGTLKTVA